MNFQKLIRDCIDQKILGSLQRENFRQIEQKMLSVDGDKTHALVIKFKKDEQIVIDGQAVSKIGKQIDFSCVPLGIILNGNVSVIKDGKGTKQLKSGDFIGLFETVDWLLTKKNRHLGEWTLVAQEDLEILFFKKEFFDPLLEMKIIPKTYEEINDSLIKYLLLLAKNDPVPQPITELPLLDFVALHTTDKRYPDTLVVTHTHLLPNNVPFFRQLSALTGFGKIILLEKPYSTVTSALQNMILAGAEIIPVNCKNELSYNFAVLRSIEVLWHRILEERGSGVKRILIIDDGADVLLSVPWESLRGIEIVAVEQTQKGISQLQKTTKEFPPVVSVATCGIKKEVETIFIGENIAKKLSENNQIIAGKKIGIVGFGGIGRGVANAVASSASKVFVYDNKKNEERNDALHYCNTLDELIQKSDVVIGTTGKDALRGIALDRITGQKVLISASSKDIEFYSILQLVKNNPDPFGTIELQVHNKLKLTILNGGYPFNFDRKSDATPNEDIVLTRSLLYIASMQALRFLSPKNKNKIYDLDQQAQEELLRAWIKMKNEDRYNLLNAKEIAARYSLTMEHKTPPVWIT